MSIPIGLELYSVREDCKKDFSGTVAKVAKMGYTCVEFAGYWDHTADQVKAMLDDNGLTCSSAHTGLPLLQGDKFDETVAFAKAIGNTRLIVPGLPGEFQGSVDNVKRAADALNEIAEKLAPHGMRTGYHNHAWEFTKLETGEYPWDVLFSNLREDVIMQVDSGNAMGAGEDIIPFVKKYPGRAASVHLKEHTDAPEGATIGNGTIAWDELFQVCESIGGTDVYIVEQEVYPVPPLEACQQCIDALRKMGK